MGQDEGSALPDGGRFDRTHWSLVLAAMQSRAQGAPEALATLSSRYWRPLYAFARQRGCSPEDAEDLVQGFFGHLLGSRGLSTVDRSKGKFRSFMLASFQNFMSGENRKVRAEKRGGRAELLSFDCQDAEARLSLEPADRLTPETIYDAQWALLLLQRATGRLEQEQAKIGKAAIFQTLKGFLAGEVGSPDSITYEGAGQALGLSKAAVTTNIHRLRQRHRQLVREEVQATLLEPTQVDAELHALCEALVQAEGRVRTPDA